MGRMKLKYLSFLLLLLPLCFALTIDDFRITLPLTVVIVCVFLGLAFMAARLFQSPSLEAWVKSEIAELIVAGVLFAVVMGLFFGSNPIVGVLTGTPNYKQDSLTFLGGMKNTASAAYVDVIKSFHLIGLMSGYSTSLALSVMYFGGHFGSSPYMGYSSFFIFLSQAANGLSGILFLYSALEVFLDFFLKTSDKLIFVAFAFRVVPFTRQLGSTLIGFFVGVYVILPFAILLVSAMHGQLGSDMPYPRVKEFGDMEVWVPPGANFICDKVSGTIIRFLFGFFGELGFALPICIPIGIATFGAGFMPCMTLLTTIIYPILTMAIMIAWDAIILATSFPSTDTATAIFDVLKPFLQDVNNLVVLSYVDAIVVLTLTYIGAKGVATALGGEYMIPSIQRLI